jgi:hypothetical protein
VLNLLLIISFPLISFYDNPYVENKQDDAITFKPWQSHVAAIGIMTTWVINMIHVGKIPKFGIYVQMLLAVGSNLFNFLVAFYSLVIAFALSFVVLFPSQASLNNFLTAPIKVLAMMTGELEYNSLFYPMNQIITLDLNSTNGNGTISFVEKELDYAVTPQILLAVFVIIVSIVIMNLLIGEAGIFYCRNCLIIHIFYSH